MASPVLQIHCYDEEMMALTLNKDDKQWISDKISKSAQDISASIEQIKDSIQLISKRKHWPQWGVTIGLSAILVALLGMALSEHSAATKRQSDEAAFEAKTTLRLDNIEATLLNLRAAKEPRTVLKELGTVPSPVFAHALPALRAVVESSVTEVRPQPDTLTEVASKLHAVPEAIPDYWTTTLSFIRWASAGISPDVPPPGLPDFGFSASIVDVPLTSIYGIIRHRVFLLDGVSMRDGVFENCRIIFSGRPSTLKNIKFINCVFDVPIIESPPVPLKRFSEQLLAQGIGNVRIDLENNL